MLFVFDGLLVSLLPVSACYEMHGMLFCGVMLQIMRAVYQNKTLPSLSLPLLILSTRQHAGF